jgi:uncharacterized integral membrane protein
MTTAASRQARVVGGTVDPDGRQAEEHGMAQAPEEVGGPSGAKRARAVMGENREIIRLIVGGVGLVLLIAFVVGNSNDVRVNFIFANATTSLIWVILVSAVLGLLVDRLIIAIGNRRKKG